MTEVFPPQKGGSGRWLWELYRRFPHGSVFVAAAASDGAKEFDGTHDLPIERLPLRFPTWGLFCCAGARAYTKALARLDALVRRVRPEAIHCGKCLPEGFLARVLKVWRGLPYICYVHGEELTLTQTSRQLRWMTRWVLKGADILIANSLHTQGILVRDWGLSAAKITVMHPGTDTKRFVPRAPNPAVRACLGWEGRRVVLTVGALQKRKGQDMMIRALPSIRRRCPDVLYAIAGEGWERSYLETLVAELGVGDCVQFRGVPTDEELVDCYQQCDLFVLANRRVGWDFEGFGIVLLEAQACGKPVLAGASGGTAETMDAPHTGWVVPCEEPERLADAVVELLDQATLRDQMGHQGPPWVSSRFDWEVLGQQAQQLFAAGHRAHGRGFRIPMTSASRGMP